MTTTAPTLSPALSPAGDESALLGNRGPAVSAVDAFVGHLEDVLGAVTEVATSVQLLAACRYAPAPVIEAAVTDLANALRAMQALGPAGGRRPLGEMQAEVEALGIDDTRIAVLRSSIATTVADIESDSSSLSLELRRLMADLRDVVSLGTGSTGTYDASGRTTLGEHRRRHSVM